MNAVVTGARRLGKDIIVKKLKAILEPFESRYTNVLWIFASYSSRGYIAFLLPRLSFVTCQSAPWSFVSCTSLSLRT